MTYKEALESIAHGSNPSTNHNTAISNAPANNTAVSNAPANNTAVAAGNRSAPRQEYPQLPGTILRIFIPEGTAINFLNFFEVASPGGIYFHVRLPFLGGLTSDRFKNSPLLGVMDAIKAAGGTIELLS